MSPNRRNLLRLIGRVAKMTLLGGFALGLSRLLRFGSGQRHTAAPRVDEKAEYTFRPPGALPEPAFLSSCIHCYLCQDACPPGCIQMKPDGDADRHTPFIIPSVKACTLCLKCGDVCPTGALRPSREKENVRMGVAGVDETICVSHNRTGVCGACFTACPLRGKAITQGLYNAPVVHPEHCTGCGLCEELCIVPYRAIRVYPNAEIARASTGSST
ncbi:MAG: 4Fe-4S dicluster domain-containing protein [Planctomycetales bacterium]